MARFEYERADLLADSSAQVFSKGSEHYYFLLGLPFHGDAP